MTSQPNIRIIHTVFTVLLFLTLLSGTVAPVAAIPYTVLIEDPGVWSITGSFESSVHAWNSPADISNWTFEAVVNSLPAFAVGPFTATSNHMIIIAGSAKSGIELLQINDNTPEHSIFYKYTGSQYTVDIINSTPFADDRFTQIDSSTGITNSVSAVPEPTTALLLLTGLGGLAGYRWSQARRETK